MVFKPPSLLEFQQYFATEDDCSRFLYERRWKDGWNCPRCRNNKCYPIKDRALYECSACRYQVSVTAGTVLHKTRTSLRLWFLAIFLVTTDKRGISSVGLGRQLGISQKKAWYTLHKLRRAMGERDGHYRLDGLVELDASFFGSPKEGGCRGRCVSKQKVLVGLSRTPEGKPGRLRLKVLQRGDRVHLEQAVALMVAPGAHIKTNGLRGFLSLGAKGFAHERVVVKDAASLGDQGWRKVIVSNVKAVIGGTYHGLGQAGGKHLQAYLDEYGYRFSRRHRPDLIFTSCIMAVAACPIWTYRDIVGGRYVQTGSKLRGAEAS